MNDIEQAKKDQQDYTKALIRGDSTICIKIEHKYGLYGYSPEIVSLILDAVTKGEEAADAVDHYMERVPK